ncbi:MAG: DUF4145 domain-containing protein [Bacteroidetes bacterium]|nr:DUF4145 domain-containing protein [Bacteroidota bacterium]
MEPFNWRCPHCGQNATVTDANYSRNVHEIELKGKDGPRCVVTTVISCPNNECQEYQISAYLFKAEWEQVGGLQDHYSLAPIGEPLANWSVKPQFSAIQFPNYIPKPIVDDYLEACSILTLSPKASATLSRRCLQGIIRDFWEVKRGRLVDEIKQLRGKIDDSIWDAIDALRKLGNISAHMEGDINVILDVDPHEAEALKNLIELLIEETYIARHEREQRLKKVVDISVAKDDERKKSGKS